LKAAAAQANARPAAITKYLDAAVTLIENLLPLWHWEIHSDGGAMLRDPSCSAFAYSDHCGFAKTPALAVCAALLTALIEKEQAPARIDDEDGGSDADI
jgi:hypothetical protein